MNNAVLKHVPMAALVQQYEVLAGRINVIFDNIEAFEKELKIAVDDDYYGIDYNLRRANRSRQTKDLRKVFWKYACDKLLLYNLMSQKAREEFDEQLEHDDLPDFTLENVHSTFQRLIDNVGGLVDDAIQEAFEIFRPHNSEYKTNTEFAVGKRAILSRMIDTFLFHGKRRHPSLDYRQEQKLRVIDNAFSLMDGKGPIKYPGDSITVIKEAISTGQPECETTYFKYRWHMNGTLHITFKRMDLVQRMNEIGGKGLLVRNAA